MKKLKYEILFTILIMTIGIAVVSSNVVINGSTPIAANIDDFNIYFSKVENVSNTSGYEVYATNSNTILANGDFSALNDQLKVNYEITNASKDYGVSISFSCTDSDEYLNIDYDIQDSVIPPRGTITGYFTVTMIKSYTGTEALNKEISCTFNVEATEETEKNEMAVPDELPTLIPFTITSYDKESVNTYYAEEGMTLGEWAQSKYNYDGKYSYYDPNDGCNPSVIYEVEYSFGFNFENASRVIVANDNYEIDLHFPDDCE